MEKRFGSYAELVERLRCQHTGAECQALGCKGFSCEKCRELALRDAADAIEEFFASREKPAATWGKLPVENSSGPIFRCSNCGGLHNPNKEDVVHGRIMERPPYCPNCGAKMS